MLIQKMEAHVLISYSSTFHSEQKLECESYLFFRLQVQVVLKQPQTVPLLEKTKKLPGESQDNS